MTEAKKALFSKLVQVLKDAETVKKSGRNDHLKFDYSLESDIIEAIRKSLIKYNLFVFTSVEGVERVEDLTSCKLKITFVDGDTGEDYSIFSFGQGQSKQDFGLAKSITQAMKSMWTKNFLLQGELSDIENDGVTPIKQPKPIVKEQPKKVEPKPEVVVTKPIASIPSTTTFVKKPESTTTKPKFGEPPVAVKAPTPKPTDEEEDF